MTETAIAQRLAALRQALADAAGDWPAPSIVAVTKTRSAQEILSLRGTGICDIGENRVQEALGKLDALQGAFRLHMIGRLQRNKVKHIVPVADMIQSVDSLALLQEINRWAAKSEKRMPVLIQISPAGEPQKGGLPPEALPALLTEASGLEAVQVMGLMAVMPAWADAEKLHELFRNMRQLFDRTRDEAPRGIKMEELSMGMSGDCLLAAAHGATMVRVGSAIFGPRETAPEQEERACH